jgi:hypothetical protein
MMSQPVRRSDRLNPNNHQEDNHGDDLQLPGRQGQNAAADGEIDLPAQDATLSQDEQLALVRRLFLDRRFSGSFSGTV